MRAVLPTHPAQIHQTQIRLVDERGRLECLAGTFAPYDPTCQPAQFRMHERDQLLERVLISVPPGVKEMSDLMGQTRVGCLRHD